MPQNADYRAKSEPCWTGSLATCVRCVRCSANRLLQHLSNLVAHNHPARCVARLQLELEQPFQFIPHERSQSSPHACGAETLRCVLVRRGEIHSALDFLSPRGAGYAQPRVCAVHREASNLRPEESPSSLDFAARNLLLSAGPAPPSRAWRTGLQRDRVQLRSPAGTRCRSHPVAGCASAVHSM